MANRHEIAARLRALCEGTRLDVGTMSERLRVGEASLRRSLDELSPYQTLEVLIAAIRYFGLDPAWLITGEYSSASHVHFWAAEEDGREDEVRRFVSDLTIQGLYWPIPPVSSTDTSLLT